MWNGPAERLLPLLRRAPAQRHDPQAGFVRRGSFCNQSAAQPHSKREISLARIRNFAAFFRPGAHVTELS